MEQLVQLYEAYQAQAAYTRQLFINLPSKYLNQ
jgi:hypothetical protein